MFLREEVTNGLDMMIIPTSSDDRDSELLGACLNDDDDDVEVDADLNMMHTRKYNKNSQLTLNEIK